jgi:hypothetical protein
MLASQAETIPTALGQQPVAGVLTCIRAKETSAGPPDGPEARSVAIERQESAICWIIAEPVAATAAASVFEIQNVFAALAGKNLHGRIAKVMLCARAPFNP